MCRNATAAQIARGSTPCMFGLTALFLLCTKYETRLYLNKPGHKLFKNITHSLMCQSYERSSEHPEIEFRSFFLVSYVGERPWWPIQCLNKGRKKKAKG